MNTQRIAQITRLRRLKDQIDDLAGFPASEATIKKRTALCLHRWKLWCKVYPAEATWAGERVSKVLRAIKAGK